MTDTPTFLRRLAEKLQAEDDAAEQLDLDGRPNTIPPDPPAPVDPGPPPVQLGLDVDVPVAIRKRQRGPVVAWQDPLGGEA